MNLRKKPDVDVIKEILEWVIVAQPKSGFAQSLYIQYQERGTLSKKQLEGLLNKCSRLPSISAAHKATLEAIIKRKFSKTKSVLPENKELYTKDETTLEKVTFILTHLPQHKAIQLIHTKIESHFPLNPIETKTVEQVYALVKQKFSGQ
jgi:hypothetical protein